MTESTAVAPASAGPSEAPAAPQSSPPSTPPAASTSGTASLSASVSDALNAFSGLRAQASHAADGAVHAVLHTLAQGIALGLQQYGEVKAVACTAYKQGEAVVGDGLRELQKAEDAAVAQAKGLLITATSLPAYWTYPVLGLGTLLALPVTRRAMYQATFGRLRSPDSIKAASTSRVEGLKGKLDEVAQESQKLSERMRAAEEEMRRGMSALKETRLAMQQLASVASKSEKVAANVLDDLRRIKKVDNTSALRAEAASQLASFRSHYGQLQKNIRRIASQDI